MYSYVIVDFVSGDEIAAVIPARDKWGRRLNVMSSGTAAFPLLAEENAGLDWWALTATDLSRVFVVRWNQVPIYAGLITRRDLSEKNVLTIQHTDTRFILSRRTTFGEDGYSIVNYQAVYENYSLRTLVLLFLRLVIEGPTANWALPIDFENIDPLDPSKHDGDQKRSIFDYERQFTNNVIDEILRTDGGPDLEFVPYYDATRHLRYQVRVGALTGNTFEFNMTAEQNGALDLTYSEDGAKMATDVTITGKGSELGTKFATARVDTPWVPAKQRVISYAQIDDVNVLQDHANADLAVYSKSTKQWSLSVLLSDDETRFLDPTSFVLGSTIRLYFKRHPFFPDGWQDMRLVGFTGDESLTLKLLVQPIGGVD